MTQLGNRRRTRLPSSRHHHHRKKGIGYCKNSPMPTSCMLFWATTMAPASCSFCTHQTDSVATRRKRSTSLRGRKPKVHTYPLTGMSHLTETGTPSSSPCGVLRVLRSVVAFVAVCFSLVLVVWLA